MLPGRTVPRLCQAGSLSRSRGLRSFRGSRRARTQGGRGLCRFPFTGLVAGPDVPRSAAAPRRGRFPSREAGPLPSPAARGGAQARWRAGRGGARGGACAGRLNGGGGGAAIIQSERVSATVSSWCDPRASLFRGGGGGDSGSGGDRREQKRAGGGLHGERRTPEQRRRFLPGTRAPVTRARASPRVGAAAGSGTDRPRCPPRAAAASPPETPAPDPPRPHSPAGWRRPGPRRGVWRSSGRQSPPL